MDVCYEVARDAVTTPNLRLRCFVVVAELVRRCSALDPETFPQMPAVVALAKRFMRAFVLPELQYAPGVTHRVMQAAAVEFVHSLYQCGRVFGAEALDDDVEPDVFSGLVPLVDHTRLDTRIKIVRIFVKRLPLFTRHQRLLVDRVFVGSFWFHWSNNLRA